MNLGVHLVRDAYSGAFEQAAVLTNDTDLFEPIRIVREDAGLPIILLTPVNNPAKSLKNIATSVRHIEPYIKTSQFSDPVTLEDGISISKPPTW